VILELGYKSKVKEYNFFWYSPYHSVKMGSFIQNVGVNKN